MLRTVECNVLSLIAQIACPILLISNRVGNYYGKCLPVESIQGALTYNLPVILMASMSKVSDFVL